MSMDWLRDVEEFQRKFGFTVSDKPGLQSDKVKAFRRMLIEEEVRETLLALADDNFVELADGIADSIYVLLGTAVSYGIDIRPIWDEVHRSNMAKVEGPERGDGTKPLKPDGWQPPAVAELLTKQATRYDEIASEYFEARHRTCRNFDRTTVEALRAERWPYIRRPILEVGAGKGRCLEFLGHPAAVHVDSSMEMLNLQPREPGIRVHCDARRMPFPDNSFATVVAFLCDPYMSPEFIRELYRVTCTSVLFTTPCSVWAEALRGGKRHETTFVTDKGEKVTVPSNVYSGDEIARMLADVGFEGEVTSHCLPGTADPSDAIIKAANNAGVTWTKLPIVTVARALKIS